MTEARADYTKILQQTPIFSGLTEAEMRYVAQCASPRQYPAGTVIFGEGEPCAGLYIVLSGHIRVYKTSAAGREQVLTVDGPGSSVAEIPVFDGGPYPASGAAATDATLLFIGKQDFQSLCLAHPEVALKVLRVVGARLRRLVGIIEELSFTTVRRRLIALLVKMAQREGRRTAAGVAFGLAANNQELAAQIGTVRELVSRNLSRLQAEGSISLEGRSVTVLDLKALEAELENSE